MFINEWILHVSISGGNTVDDCKCYTREYRCPPSTERVPTCTLGRFRTKDVVCCKLRKLKDKGRGRKPWVPESNTLNRSPKSLDIRELVRKFVQRRFGKYVWNWFLFCTALIELIPVKHLSNILRMYHNTAIAMFLEMFS